MKNKRFTIPALCAIPLLSSCATPQKTAGNDAWDIQPTFRVANAIETPDAYYQLGRYYQGQNRYEQAVAAYQKALAIDGGFVEARNGLGVVYARQGRQQEAIAQFRLAATQAPNAAHIYNNLGYALYLNGAYAESVSTLERAIALEPANHSARTNLALALNKAGNRGEALQVMAQAQATESAAPQTVINASAVPAVPTAAQVSPPMTKEAQQALALPKDWGVITQPERKSLPVAESRIQSVQLAPNVYALRERKEVRVTVAAVHDRAQGVAVAQLAQKSPPSDAKNDASAARPESRVAEHQAQAAVQPAKPYGIEISNGNGVTGMAKKVADAIGTEGFLKVRLTNQQSFQVASSQVSYRSGYREQAQSLASTLPGYPRVAQTNNLRGDIDIKVVLGKDMAHELAYFDKNRLSQGKIRLALNENSKNGR